MSHRILYIISSWSNRLWQTTVNKGKNEFFYEKEQLTLKPHAKVEFKKICVTDGGGKKVIKRWLTMDNEKNMEIQILYGKFGEH